MSSSASNDAPRFRDLALSPSLLKALDEVGYETPSPIQAQTIPSLLAGADVLGQAQTGTGKTAAFALPALNRTDLSLAAPQTLVLAPTRELAIQVAEAFQRYATHLPGFHVLPIYGGQSYQPQLRGLRRGVHAVVGTPGRVVDHIKRGTLKLAQLRMLVLDEADEMLRMGFIDDVEWILQQTPENRQVALFSATMPSVIKRVARTHLKSPVEVLVKSKTTTAANIRQRYWMVSGRNKLDALTRLLELEPIDAMIVFARTKLATEELAQKLAARGFSASALNGDLDQKQRERIVARLRQGSLDVVVATDVAARGLDVERVSHVLNYDIPTDTESYVHRIGRTGRAGRTGEAILFVSHRERRLLAAIEKATRQSIAPMTLPSDEALQTRREEKFQNSILELLANESEADHIAHLRGLIEQLCETRDQPAEAVASALARLLQMQNASMVPPLPKPRPGPRQSGEDADENARSSPSPHPVSTRDQAASARHKTKPTKREGRESGSKRHSEPMEQFRVEVGHQHGLKPGNLVGAIANEADLDAQFIGRVDIHDDHSFVELPVGMPKAIFRDLQKVWVMGQQLRMSRTHVPASASKSSPKSRKPKPKRKPRG